jgi:hypothetical protein
MVDFTGNPYLCDSRFGRGNVGSAHCAHPTRATPIKATITWQVHMPGDDHG